MRHGYPFTTKDQDNDSLSIGNCAVIYKGAWWYRTCTWAKLNGIYHGTSHSVLGLELILADGEGLYVQNTRRAEMKIRPVKFYVMPAFCVLPDQDKGELKPLSCEIVEYQASLSVHIPPQYRRGGTTGEIREQFKFVVT